MIVLMGVCGCGKTTVGELLAASLCWPYYDADDYHPPDNVAKMRSGAPLTDTDREPWLAALNRLLKDLEAQGQSSGLGCSALREAYRRTLLHGVAGARLVYMKGSRSLIATRLEERVHRYMPASLLDSQFAALEEPRDAMVVDVAPAPDQIAAQIRSSLGL